MNGFSDLIEFSIALAGFTSIVVVFAHKDEKWKPFDKFRITNALMGSLGAAFMAAIPNGLAYLQLTEQQIWKTEGFVIALYLLVFLFSVLRRRATELSDNDRQQIPHKIINMIIFINFTFSAILFTSLLGLHSLEIKALCYFGIIFLLLSSVFAFIRIIFYRPIDNK